MIIRRPLTACGTVAAFALSILVIGSLPVFGAGFPATSTGVWQANPMTHVRRPLTTLSPTGLSPSQIRASYGLPSTGGHGTIAIIDAFDDPTASSDLSNFSLQFGLPAPVFEKHTMSSGIATDGNWALEISLDIEWAHAIAPNAKILLVEATTNSFSNLLAAVDYARGRSDVVAVSMSWGGGEFSGETSYDSHFLSAYNAAFFASSGDSGAGVSWPAVSANVIGVGGTTLNFNSGVLSSETAWSGSGGGVSSFEPEPAYQSTYGVSGANGMRSVPDVSYDADPNSGVSVLDSTPYSGSSGWWTVGGTSAGAPQWAAIQSLGLTASNANFYRDARFGNSSSYFRDITSGSNGHPALTGYDLVTGLGSPLTITFGSAPQPGFSVSASPTSLSISAGSSGTSTVTLASLNGFNGTVQLAASPPAGLSATLNPTGVPLAPGGTGTSSLKISVAQGTPSGTYSVAVTATSGATTHSVTLTVTVPAPASPDFSVSASPSSLTIRPGRSSSSTVTATSVAGFTGVVTLQSSAPSGFSVTLSPTSVSLSSGGSGTSTLRVTVGSGVKAGTYTITVTGTSGSLTHSVTLKVVVKNH